MAIIKQNDLCSLGNSSVDKIRPFGHDQCSANSQVKLPVSSLCPLLYICTVCVMCVCVLLCTNMLMVAYRDRGADTLAPVLFQQGSYQCVCAWW